MDNFLPTSYQQYIHKSRYARFVDEDKKRESWPETVKRYFDFMEVHLKENHKHRMVNREELEEAVIQYLATNQQRHDLVTIMINNKCSFSLSNEGSLEISKEEA